MVFRRIKKPNTGNESGPSQIETKSAQQITETQRSVPEQERTPRAMPASKSQRAILNYDLIRAAARRGDSNFNASSPINMGSAQFKHRKINLPKTKKRSIALRNYLLTLDYQAGPLKAAGVKEVVVLDRPPSDVSNTLYVIKFKANEHYLGAAIFDITLIDGVLGHAWSQELQNLDDDYHRAIIEELRLRLVKQFDLLQTLQLAPEFIPLKRYLAEQGKKLLEHSILSVDLTVADSIYTLYILSAKSVYEKLSQAIMTLPVKSRFKSSAISLTYPAEFFYAGIFLTKQELTSITPGAILLVSRPERNTYFRINTRFGLWGGCLQSINKVKLEGTLNMSELEGKIKRPPVEVSIAIDAKQISLSEVEKFSPGYIIDSGHTLDKHYPLLINNVQVGTCVLVDVEGNIGFQVVGLDKEYLTTVN